MAALAVLLTTFSFGYGFERDELYFRTLRPAWGYVDTPPLTPLLARLASHVSSSPWAMRAPATILAVGSVLVVVLITRELGGGRGAHRVDAGPRCSRSRRRLCSCGIADSSSRSGITPPSGNREGLRPRRGSRSSSW
jgi:hypothetical protein